MKNLNTETAYNSNHNSEHQTLSVHHQHKAYSQLTQYLKGGEEELNQLIRKVTFFKKGEDKMLQRKYYKQIKDCLSFHFAAKNSFLFHHESRSDYFYIILKGKCQVLIPKKQNEVKIEESCLSEMQDCQSQINQYINDDDEYRANIQQQKMTVIQKKLEDLRSDSLNQFIKEQSKALQDIYFSLTNKDINRYKAVLTLSSGDYFGESTFSTVPKRNGSILVNEDTYFARLKREDFLRIYENEIINQSISKQYLTKIFSHLNNTKLDHINSYVEEVQISKSQVIFSQGQKNDGFIYFVSSGSFEVNYYFSSAQSVIKNVQDNLIEQQLFKYNKQQHIRLLTLTEGEIFGIEDINKEVKSFGVICSTAKGSIFRFRQAILQQIEDDESIKRIKKLGQQRYSRIQQKIQQAMLQREEVTNAEKLQNLNIQSTSPKKRISIEKSTVRSFTPISPKKEYNASELNLNNSSMILQNLSQISTSHSNNILSLTHIPENVIEGFDDFKIYNSKLQSKNDFQLRLKGQKRDSIRRQHSFNVRTQPSLTDFPQDASISQINENELNRNHSFILSNNNNSQYLKSQSPVRRDTNIEKDISEKRIMSDLNKLSRPRIFSTSKSSIKSSSPVKISSPQKTAQLSPVKVSHSPMIQPQPLQLSNSVININEFAAAQNQQTEQYKKQKIQSLHNKHFSIFTQEQFNDMCNKSDLRPSLNPMMIKKRIKQELISKSIYRNIQKPNYLKSSSSQAKELLNKTINQTEKNDLSKSFIQNQPNNANKVRSISTSLCQNDSPVLRCKNESITSNNQVSKGKKQMQNYQFQMINLNRKSKLQNFDFPVLLQSQVKQNYFNSNIYPAYIPSNGYPQAQTQGYSPTKGVKNNNNNKLTNSITSFENFNLI